MLKKRESLVINNEATSPATSESFLKNVVSKENIEYVSPFRNPADVCAANYANAKKLQRYPTVSASSPFSLKNPNEFGYNNIEKSTKRAKDIPFPNFLVDNERRQGTLLTDLQFKEANLKYIKDSQRILNVDEDGKIVDEEKQADVKETEEEEEVEEEVEEEEEEVEQASEKELLEGKDAEKNDKQEEAAMHDKDVAETPLPMIEGDIVTYSAFTEMEYDFENQQEEEQESEEFEEEEEEEELAEPADPALAPMVQIAPTPKESSGGNKFLSMLKGSSAPVSVGVAAGFTNVIATPKNPEYIVKTKDNGQLSKAVYDKIEYEKAVHNRWISKYNKDEEYKYNNKRNDYEDQLATLQSKVDNIQDMMDEFKLKTSQKIEVLEYQLVKNILDVTETHSVSKNKIFKETELMKLETLNAKKQFVNKQGEIKLEIEKLNDEKTTVANEFELWNATLLDLTGKLDDKIKVIEDINLSNIEVKKEIENLQIEKLTLENEIKNNEEIHQSNTVVLTNLNVKKDYLPKLHEIDRGISERLDKLAVIKKEAINENNQLTFLTKKLEEERIAHEREIKEKNENIKLEQEQLLKKQLNELQAKHDEELKQIQTKYEKILVEKANSNKKQANNVALDNDSQYEYEIEEEIISI